MLVFKTDSFMMYADNSEPLVLLSEMFMNNESEDQNGCLGIDKLIICICNSLTEKARIHYSKITVFVVLLFVSRQVSCVLF